MGNHQIQLARIRLENFAKIKSGMDQTILDIDFTKLPYPITLLIGKNGSGKTTMLRCFHPFAYNGATGDDGKESSALVLPNKDGKKEVWLSYDADTQYHITHHYLRKKDGTLTVKSYIKECSVEYGEEELNESGSVTEFKEILQDSFGLKESYLNLLSIGNTLNSFVKYTASERKKYAVSLFNTLDLYPGFYKKATALVRETKPILSNVTAKLEQYRATDVDGLERERNTRKKSVARLRSKLEALLIEKGGYEKQIEGTGDILRTCKEAEERISALTGMIEEGRKKVSGRKLEDLKTDLQNTQKEFEQTSLSLDQTKMLMQSDLTAMNNTLQTATTIQTTLEKMEKDLDIRELENTVFFLEEKKKSLNIPDNFPRPELSANNLLVAKMHLDQFRDRCYDFITIDANHPGLVLTVWDALQEDPNKIEKMKATYEKAKRDLAVHRAAHPVTRQLSQVLDLLKAIPECKCDAKDTCSYALFYQQVVEAINDKKYEVDLNDERKEDIVDLFEAKVTVAETIVRITDAMRQCELIWKLPKGIFDPSGFVEYYMTARNIYDSESLDYVIDITENYEQKDRLEQDIAQLQEKIARISATRDLYDNLLAQKAELDKDAEIVGNRIQDYEKDLNYQCAKKDRLESSLKKLNSQIEMTESLASMRNEMKTLRDGLSALKKEYQRVLKLQENLDTIDHDIKNFNREISVSESQIQEIEHTLLSISSLQAEQSTLYQKLQEAMAIQEAVSPTTGIPMEFLRDTIGKVLIQSVNQILKEVYQERFRLDENALIINEKDFVIPYIWNGHHVGDIAQASDGQQAILTLAFSIVLLEMTAPEYRTLLLDEADTTLDVHSRAVALELLENFTQKANAGQVFNITHNSMFDGYPANILLTSEEVVSNIDPNSIVLCYKGGNH